MDAGTCNASAPFVNYAYNMSGVTTEQSEVRTTTIQGENLNSTFNGIEFIDGNDDEVYEFQDVEIIEIDPNSFYSDSEGVDDDEEDEEDEEDDDEDDETEENNSASATTSFKLTKYESQAPCDDFDIITLNIDEDFPIDTHDDDILFKNNHQFDLASYIGGESTTLLLSPVNDAAIRRRMMSLSDCTQLEHTVSNLSRMSTNKVAHDKVTKTPASNRRKRKNLSREFIETSDSDEDDKPGATNSVKQMNDNGNSNINTKLQNVNDPVWCSNADKRATLLKPTKDIANRNNSNDSWKATKAAPSPQGKGLRDMLKHQMLSDRPINQAKLLKTMTSSAGGSFEMVTTIKVPENAVKRTGVGRGKDIAITAKYYNCNESSDDSERDKSYKHDRYYQIYSDSDESDGSDDSDVDVNSSKTLPEVVSKEIKNAVVEIERRKEKPREDKISNHVEKISYPVKSAMKIANGTTKPIAANKPIAMDSSSMDSTDFAKALVTNAKAVTKTKSSASIIAKKKNLEKQKRLIQSTLLLQNPAKFSLFSVDKNKPPQNGTITSSEEKKAGPITVNESKPDAAKTVSDLPSNVGNELISDNQIKTETERVNEDTKHEVKEIKEEEEKLDVMIVEENKVESNAKRKLNVQEYLKRKNLKTCNNNGIGGTDNLTVNIKIEKPENQVPAGSKPENDESNNEEPSSNTLAANSMYEEIIIVSMGCNTDISIPEASFLQPSEIKDSESIKSTVLLSDIQTSVEKANSKISCCSLISSIQEVILKKTHSIEQNGKKEAKSMATHGVEDAENGREKTDEKPEHGENKVIMHLRKDRVRPTRASTSIQTDPYFQFPPLKRFTPLSKKQTSFSDKRMSSIARDSRSNEVHFLHSDGKNRTYRNYHGQNHFSESSYYSDEDQKTAQRPSRHSDFMEHKNVRHSRVRRESSRYSSSKYDRYSRPRTISRSLSSSSDNSTTSTDSSSSSQSSSSSSTYVSSTSARSLNSYGGSSSKSYYGDDHQYYRQRTTSNNSRRSNYRSMTSKRSNSPEERRIVYVGRIEEETTKEELRRKFSVYGQVKHVSMHCKETKMRYGFVTFVRPGDAYTAIDDSSKNPAICHYDISFGGRRAFCREKYLDLDNSGMPKYREEVPKQKLPDDDGDSFDVLLRKMKEKLQENKK